MKNHPALGLIALACTVTCGATTLPLTAITGTQIGLRSFDYTYQEQVQDQAFMSLKGTKLGLDANYTQALRHGQYWRVEGAYAIGWLNYDSQTTGSSSGQRSEYVDIRATMGRDLAFSGMVLAPYAGLGYRQLRHDGRGTNEVNGRTYLGYRRVSEYTFLPLGLEWRLRAGPDARLVVSAEYDYLLAGTQRSFTTDVGAESDLVNRQRTGYGARLQASYEWSRWSAGLYYQQWAIADSDSSCYEVGTKYLGGYEPRNTTRELGVRVAMRF